MTKARKFLLLPVTAGAFAAVLMAGAAYAQGGDNDYGYSQDRGENIIVRPQRHPLGVIHTERKLGTVNGEMNPMEISLSRAVDYSDLDLSRVADLRELHSRIRDTARGVCAEIDAANPTQHDAEEERECVIAAIRDADKQIPSG